MHALNGRNKEKQSESVMEEDRIKLSDDDDDDDDEQRQQHFFQLLLILETLPDEPFSFSFTTIFLH